MSQGLVFLNISDAPGLGVAETKRMRAHVTRANFAQRRQRIAQQYREDEDRRIKDNHRRKTLPSHAVDRKRYGLKNPPPLDPTVEYTLLLTPTDTHLCISYLLEDFKPLVFPAGVGSPYGLKEHVWIDLLVAAPALLNASMYVKLRFFAEKGFPSVSRRATMHVCKAIELINGTLGTPYHGLSDGMLAAVFMLGIAERLANNRAGWDVHVAGLTHMILLRRSQGDGFIPQWFSDLILYDAIAESVLSSQVHHTKHVNALQDQSSQVMGKVSTLSHSIHHLRDMLNLYHTDHDYRKRGRHKIKARVADLHRDLTPLRDSEATYICALGRSLELFLHLSWPSNPEVDYYRMAEKLKEALGNPHARPCSSFHLKVWQYFVGAVAIDGGSETREWFMRELRRMFQVIEVFQWEEVVQILERAYFPDSRLLVRFRGVWDELGVAREVGN